MNTGGPAFPVPMLTRQADGQPITAGEFFDGGNGMTLRDYFAAACIGQIPMIMDRNDENLSYANMAEHFYKMADAMLEARKEGA